MPGDYPTIQQAIDAAWSGDEIIVAPGTYPEAIDFSGKDVWLHSSDGPEVTTIDATGLDASVVTCVNGEGADTVLEGFTITGGTGTYDDDWWTYVGGGMYNAGASPTLTNCTFSGNTAADYGGGIHNESDSDPTVTNCTFSENSANTGGGMANYYASPTVTNCTFSGNTADDGGAINCNNEGGAFITDCLFSGNTASGGGGAIVNHNAVTVTNCTFEGNAGGQGGAINNPPNGTMTITNSTFTGNYAYESSALGGAIIDASGLTVTNCTFSGNSASDGGGGMFVWNDANPTVTNCIFWGNTGGEIYNDNSTMEARATSTPIRCSPIPRAATSACAPTPHVPTRATTPRCRWR